MCGNTALLSHSELPQGKFLHRDSPSLRQKKKKSELIRFSITVDYFPHNSTENIGTENCDKWITTSFFAYYIEAQIFIN